jgi:hypothetical protein
VLDAVLEALEHVCSALGHHFGTQAPHAVLQ